MRTLKQSTARNIAFLMVDSTDHVTGKTGLTVTVTLGKNGGALAAAAGSVTERTSGWYQLALTTGDTDTLGDLVLHATATGADPTDMIIGQVVAFDPTDSVRLGLTAMPNAAAAATGGLPTVDASNAVKVQSGTGANQLSLSSGVIAADVTKVNSVSGAAALLQYLSQACVYGTAATGTLSTTQATTGLTAADGMYVGRALVWLTGSLAGQATRIEHYVQSGGLLTFQALTAAPANSNAFVII